MDMVFLQMLDGDDTVEYVSPLPELVAGFGVVQHADSLG